jgi:hypothetical protein
VLASWRVLQPLLNDWHELEPIIYKPGSSVDQILKNT